MQRRIVHIVLAFFLLVVTSGITFSLHYCGDKVVSASLYSAAKSCCGIMGDCCHDKIFHLQVEDDYVKPLRTSEPETAKSDTLMPAQHLPNACFYQKEETAGIKAYDALPPPEIHTQLALFQSFLC